MSESTKICKACRLMLPISDFDASYAKSHGRRVYFVRGRCRDCELKFRRRRYKVGTKDAYLSKYGLTEFDWNIMFKNQNGLCLLCQEPLQNSIACVDHCHRTQKVRGLLCGGCNSALGFVKENTETLRRMIAFIELHQ